MQGDAGPARDRRKPCPRRGSPATGQRCRRRWSSPRLPGSSGDGLFYAHANRLLWHVGLESLENGAGRGGVQPLPSKHFRRCRPVNDFKPPPCAVNQVPPPALRRAIRHTRTRRPRRRFPPGLSPPLRPPPGCGSTPSFSISTSTTSPAWRYTGGLRAKPTPGGVPVKITSPGASVQTSEIYDINSSIGENQLRGCWSSCITRPLTRDWMRGGPDRLFCRP